jgi:hypothetical protein
MDLWNEVEESRLYTTHLDLGDGKPRHSAFQLFSGSCDAKRV